MLVLHVIYFVPHEIYQLPKIFIFQEFSWLGKLKKNPELSRKRGNPGVTFNIQDISSTDPMA